MKLRRFLAPLFVALAILVALLFAVAWLPLRQARDAWRAGHDADAIAIAERWSRLQLWPSSYHQILAAAYLTAGNRAAALAATNHVSDAAAALRTIDKSKVDAKKLAALQNAMAGNVAWIVDRNGSSIADNQDFAPFVRSLPRGSSTIATTLDPFVQRAALQAL